MILDNTHQNDKIRIAYAEDERWYRVNTVEMLEENGFEVVYAASNGRELIDFTLVEEKRPDIFLTDLNMPEMHGIQVTTELKRRWPESKVVLLSSEVRSFYITEAKKAGASAFMHKILDHKDIPRAIREIHNVGFTSLGQ